MCTDNAAKAKRLRKGASKAVMAAGGAAGARADIKTPTSKDRTEDREVSGRVALKASDAVTADPPVSRNGLREDEQTSTSATVRLPYQQRETETQAQTGPTGSTELPPMLTIVSARVGDDDGEDKITPRDGLPEA